MTFSNSFYVRREAGNRGSQVTARPMESAIAELHSQFEMNGDHGRGSNDAEVGAHGTEPAASAQKAVGEESQPAAIKWARLADEPSGSEAAGAETTHRTSVEIDSKEQDGANLGYEAAEELDLNEFSSGKVRVSPGQLGYRGSSTSAVEQPGGQLILMRNSSPPLISGQHLSEGSSSQGQKRAESPDPASSGGPIMMSGAMPLSQQENELHSSSEDDLAYEGQQEDNRYKELRDAALLLSIKQRLGSIDLTKSSILKTSQSYTGKKAVELSSGSNVKVGMRYGLFPRLNHN